MLLQAMICCHAVLKLARSDAYCMEINAHMYGLRVGNGSGGRLHVGYKPGRHTPSSHVLSSAKHALAFACISRPPSWSTAGERHVQVACRCPAWGCERGSVDGRASSKQVTGSGKPRNRHIDGNHAYCSRDTSTTIYNRRLSARARPPTHTHTHTHIHTHTHKRMLVKTKTLAIYARARQVS